jgi:hypothetical protein
VSLKTGANDGDDDDDDDDDDDRQIVTEKIVAPDRFLISILSKTIPPTLARRPPRALEQVRR